MPQSIRFIFLLSVIICCSVARVGAQCGTLAISSVTTTPVTCNGGSNGTIVVQTTGGTGPFTYSNGVSSTGPVMVALQPFSSDVVVNSGNSLTQYYSPNQCTGGKWFDYSASNGCTGGSAYYGGSTTTGFSGCYLRTPERDASGLNSVTLKFDVSHSYNSGRPDDKITFSIWIGNTYRNTTVVPVTVNGVATNELAFNQARSCVPVEVVFNLSNAILTDKSDMLLYINSSCGYNSCSAYWVAVDNAEVLQGGGSSSQSSNTFTGLPAGNYNITVQDGNGCTLTYGSNPVVVNQPSAVNAAPGFANPTTVGGFNGSAWVVASGGNSPYTYLWSNGNTNDTLYNIGAGTYTVTVTDAGGCTATASITVSNPTCNLAITSVGKVDASCAGRSNGSFTITTSGANGAVEYSINGGTNWQSSNSFTGLAAGNYNVRVRDAVGCTANASGNPQVILAPQALFINLSPTPVSTVGGSDGEMGLSVLGASWPIRYQWSTGDTIEDLTGLTVGTYCVTVTDDNGCVINGCGNVTQPTCSITVSSVVTDAPNCNGGNDGSIAITTTGANGAVEYSINGGNTWQSSSTFSGLGSGSFTVRVRDAAGCTANAPANPYTITQPAAIGLNFNVTNVSTAGGADGAINLTVSNAAPPVSHQWSNGAVTEDLTNLAAGQYCVTVTDNNGCEATGCQNVNQPGCSLAITGVVKVDVTCFGDNDGSITITTSGGVGSIDYSINGGTTWAASGSFQGLVAGSYNVQVRDDNGCVVTANGNPFVVAQPTALTLSTTTVNASQPGAADGSVNLTVSGGTPPYTYNWSNNAQTEDISNLVAGTYCVTVSDANNCTAVTCGTVTEPGNPCPGFSITNVVVTQPDCPGDDGSITISISGGQNPILYSIDSGMNFQNGVSLFTVGGGSYDILVRDDNGCEVAYANNPVIINTLQGLNPVVTIQGDTLYVDNMGVDYQWLYGGNTIANADDTSYTVIANGNYSVQVTDANGCTYVSNTVVVTGVGVEDIAGLQWQLWPNPVTDVINYSINVTGAAQMEVWASDGRLVLTHGLAQSTGSIDLSLLSGGVYSIRLVSGQQQAVKRFVKY